MTKPDDLNSLCGRQLNAPAVHNYPRARQQINTKCLQDYFNMVFCKMARTYLEVTGCRE